MSRHEGAGQFLQILELVVVGGEPQELPNLPHTLKNWEVGHSSDTFRVGLETIGCG